MYFLSLAKDKKKRKKGNKKKNVRREDTDLQSKGEETEQKPKSSHLLNRDFLKDESPRSHLERLYTVIIRIGELWYAAFEAIYLFLFLLFSL